MLNIAPMPSTTAQVLRVAASRLRAHGWAQKTLENSLGEECCSQAIRQASNTVADGRLALARIFHVRACYAIAEFIYGGPPLVLGESTIIVWNDSPGRTFDEVLVTFEKCADELDSPRKNS